MSQTRLGLYRSRIVLCTSRAFWAYFVVLLELAQVSWQLGVLQPRKHARAFEHKSALCSSIQMHNTISGPHLLRSPDHAFECLVNSRVFPQNWKEAGSASNYRFHDASHKAQLSLPTHPSALALPIARASAPYARGIIHTSTPTAGSSWPPKIDRSLPFVPQSNFSARETLNKKISSFFLLSTQS